MVPKVDGGFVSFLLLFFFSSGCITPLLCLLLLHPKKDAKFLYFFVTATMFLTFLVRLTRLQRYVWCICKVLIVLLLFWFESLVSWSGPRARHQVVLTLVSWLPLSNINVPKHQISVSADKVKNLSFCYCSSNFVISEPHEMGFSILESYTFQICKHNLHNVYRRPKNGDAIRVRF